MRKARWVWLGAAVLVAGCGGKYDVGAYPDDAATTSATSGPASSSVTGAGPTGPSITSTGAGAGGATGVGGPVDTCVMTSMKVCQTTGCHGGAAVYAGLNLENIVLTTEFRQLVRPNYGSLETAPSCPPGVFNIIDTANPEKSLIYQKLTDPAPCGSHMPQIGYPLKAIDKACILSWIESVVAIVGHK